MLQGLSATSSFYFIIMKMIRAHHLKMKTLLKTLKKSVTNDPEVTTQEQPGLVPERRHCRQVPLASHGQRSSVASSGSGLGLEHQAAGLPGWLCHFLGGDTNPLPISFARLKDRDNSVTVRTQLSST